MRNAFVICALLPCSEHKSMLFAVHTGKDGVAVFGKSAVFVHIPDAHARGCLIQIGIFTNRFCLILYCVKSAAHFIGQLFVNCSVNISGFILPSNFEAVIEKGKRFVVFAVLSGTSEPGKLSKSSC